MSADRRPEVPKKQKRGRQAVDPPKGPRRETRSQTRAAMSDANPAGGAGGAGGPGAAPQPGGPPDPAGGPDVPTAEEVEGLGGNYEYEPEDDLRTRYVKWWGRTFRAAALAGAVPAAPQRSATMPAGFVEGLQWAMDAMDSAATPVPRETILKLIRRSFTFTPSAREVEEVAELFQYQGFDPVLVTAQLLSCGKAKNQSARDVAKDIVAMIVLYLTRGTNTEKMKNRMSELGKALMDRLEKQYQIRKGAVAPKEITLARVALTYPAITIRCTVQLGEKLPVPISHMQGLVAQYPVALCTQAFSAVIPKGIAQEMPLVHAHALFLAEFSKVINPDLRNKTVVDVRDSFKAALKTALEKRETFLNDARINLVRSVGVLTGEQQQVDQLALAPGIQEAANLFVATYGPLAVN